MARPLKAGKQTVDMAAPAVRGSRIRRDPPPKLKEISIHDRDEHNRRMAMIGVAAFTIALMLILAGVSAWTGWSPRQYVVEM